MNKELWTFNEKGTLKLDNDANNYYYQWAEISVAGKDITALFKEFLGANYSEKNVRVKARGGALFIVVEGDKDDTENP